MRSNNDSTRMRVGIPTAAAVILMLALSSCSREDQEPATSARSVETIADEYLAAALQRYPQYATYYGIPDLPQDQLFDNSLPALESWQQREDAWLAELDAIGEPKQVGSRDWITFGILRDSLAGDKATRICRSELWEASSTTAWYTAVPSLFELQAVDTESMRQQVLDRMRRVPAYIDTEISNLRLGLSLGYSAPRVTVTGVSGEVRALLDEDSPFLSPAERSQDENFANALSEIFDNEVSPAIVRFADFIEKEYLPAAREQIALSANPDGAACYPALVRQFSTLQRSADAVHKTGLSQIKRIRAEMQMVIDQHFGGQKIEAFLARLSADPEYTFRSEDEVLQYSVNSLSAAKAKMPEAFGHLPKADVVIKPYPAYRASGTGEYQSSSEDGTRPGIYFIAVSDPEHRSRAAQQSVLFHETWPGHHLQGAIALELGDKVHPLARYLGNSGYGEGWGLYSERLADELGLYNGPLDRIGMLSDQAARAARLVIDTGIHTMGWTRQQSVDYMLANTAWAPVDIESEINRYISWPGQATAYMLGMLEIRRLRDKAEAELGDRFDLRSFHDRVLDYGGITLPMLDESINRWIQEQ
jgi:uncharacterized protein (DUF885 family)